VRIGVATSLREGQPYEPAGGFDEHEIKGYELVAVGFADTTKDRTGRAICRLYERWLAHEVLPEPVAAAVAELRTLRAAAQASADRLAARLRTLASTPGYAPVVAALTTHAGVGELSAIRLVLEVGDITRFGNAAAWTHYLGLTPSEYSSGDTPPHRGPIRKCGPAGVRGALVQIGPHRIDRTRWDWDAVDDNPFFCPDPATATASSARPSARMFDTSNPSRSI
jgi:transposase